MRTQSRPMSMTRPLAFLIVISMMALSIVGGCSSGGSRSEPDPSPPVQTPSGTVIKGTVPGTIIHAYGDDGSYYKTETNPADTPPRSFSLAVKPGIGYRLVLEEGGTFYPVTFDSGQNTTTNRFYMSLVDQTLDLARIIHET